MAQFEYDPKARRYRNTDSGQFVSMNTIRRMRDGIAATQANTLATIAQRAVVGELTGPAFVQAMRAEVKRTTLTQYMLGRGGRHAMTPADRGRVGALCKAQYAYLNGFAQDLMDGTLTEAQATARARLYAGASTGAFERGHAAAFSVTLPRYPGETSCMARCRCKWTITEYADRVEAIWRLDPASEHCDDCVGAAAEYAPYTIERVAAA